MMIMLEFNELCPHFTEDFMRRGLLPNFQRLYDRSTIYTTDAGEQPPNLEPWIQWVSVHSGMPFSEHGVFHLGDGPRLQQKCVAEVLSDAGVAVGIFGSMNTNYTTLQGYFLPDPWDTRGAPSPEWLMPFYKTIANQVQESSKQDAFSKRDMVRFGTFMMRNGLTWKTTNSALRQLLAERRDAGLHWRRASLLDHLQYDLFRKLNRRYGVRFATLFCNSTAHYQHYFWRNMQPELFDAPPQASDHDSLRDAILFGYQSMDRLLGRVLKDYPRAIVMLCTALSQRAWTDTTKCGFRPRSFESLLQFAGIPRETVTVKPVMAEQFHLQFTSDQARDHAEQALVDLTVCDDEPLMLVEGDGQGLFCGCKVNDMRVMDGRIRRRSDGQTMPFADLFHQIHTVRSGRHHPDGMFWLGDGRHAVVTERISIVDIAPTILDYFGVAKPPHMRGTSVLTEPATASVA